MPQIAPYGSWRSPVSSDLIASATVRLAEPRIDGADTYWIESRPSEGGRQVIVHRGLDGRTEDVNPAPFNARTRVHEYGGGAYVVHAGTTYFSNYDDQRLYRTARGGRPEPLTPAGELRYADAVIDDRRNRLVCILEDHSATGQEVTNAVAAVDLATGQHRVLVGGADFYSNPRLSPNGQRLAWLSWSHPNMPWDGCELWIGELEADGSVGFRERVAGGPREAVFGPEWSPTGYLHYTSDRSGWSNLYKWLRGTAQPLWPIEAEFGREQWVFGLSTFGFETPDRLICAYRERGGCRLARLDTTTGQSTSIETPYTDLDSIRVAGGRAVMLAGSPTEPRALVELDLATGKTEILKASSTLALNPAYLSVPEAIEFPTEDGLTAHGFYYAPRNRDFAGPTGARPPLLVKSHGGPTGATSTIFSASIQYWSSRGIAVLDVNYGGSTGYGRAYMDRLYDKWGIVDVDDCANGARYLVARGDIDPNGLLIDGGSAGGYTTLAVLTFREGFRAGASYYGVSDLEALAKETHKFESRYLDNLIGPYPARRDLYVERSPIHHVDRLKVPAVFFQGLEDKVVPPNQAELMVDALRTKGLPVAYLAYEGEQHGFRRAANIKRSLDVELYFYGRILGFTPADAIDPVRIENLDQPVRT